MAHLFVLFIGLFHQIMPMNTPGGMESMLRTPVVAAIAALGQLS